MGKPSRTRIQSFMYVKTTLLVQSLHNVISKYCLTHQLQYAVNVVSYFVVCLRAHLCLCTSCKQRCSQYKVRPFGLILWLPAVSLEPLRPHDDCLLKYNDSCMEYLENAHDSRLRPIRWTLYSPTHWGFSHLARPIITKLPTSPLVDA